MPERLPHPKAAQVYSAQRDDQQDAQPTKTSEQFSWSPQFVLRMQSTVGNHAVQRLMRRQPKPKVRSTLPSNFRIQRAEISLEQPALMNDFVQQGYAYWQEPTNKTKPVRNYAAFLVTQANAALMSLGVTRCNHDFLPSGPTGAFYKYDWSICFNETDLTENDTIQTVGALTQEQASSIAGTVYHEARHAEQTFRVARLMAGQGKDAAAIAAETYINETAAADAVKNPLMNTPETAEEFAEAQEWQKFMVGIHNEYKLRFNVFGDKAFEAWKLLTTATDADFANCKQHLTDYMQYVRDQQVPFVSSEFGRIIDIADMTPNDQMIFDMLMKIDNVTHATLERWEKVQSATNLAELNAFEPILSAFWITLFNAYEAFPHEKDAWEVGGAAGDKFKNMQPQTAQPAPAP